MLHAVACGKDMFFASEVLFPSNETNDGVISLKGPYSNFGGACFAKHPNMWQKCYQSRKDLEKSWTGSGMQHLCIDYIYGMHLMIAYLHRIQNSRNEKDQESTGRTTTEERKNCIILAEQYTHGWLQDNMTSPWYTALKLKLQIA